MRQPELRIHYFSLAVSALVDSLDDHDHLGYFLSLVAQVLLIDHLRGQLQPVLEVPPQLFLVEVHSLLHAVVVLRRTMLTLSAIMVLYRMWA